MSDDLDTLTKTNSSSRTMSNQSQSGFNVNTEHVITPDGVVTTVDNLLASGFNIATAPSSGQPTGGEAVAAALTGQSRFAAPVMKRYYDAYLVANMTTAFGNIIKGIGMVLAFVIFSGGVLAFSLSSTGPLGRNQESAALFTFVVPSLILAILTGTTFYLLGVLVAAQGQVLKASLDCAVNGSPFLTDEQRAKTMTL